ncbi:UDP-glucose--hexose-1-phosphate uridylyltransferase [Listeria costaricensis]|uniref:UDP-glucose--hexose-1-phosphate uridylyltransferase n=1 Tax=Listeria costaricensis TaxID=2026604 RepID=UPI000C082C9B|nr:UDP-glucose--hexose-1-phosphate uridylyltransferase [Listeria costaricensis]
MSVSQKVAAFLEASIKDGLDVRDAIYTRNKLLSLLGEDEFEEAAAPAQVDKLTLLDQLVELGVQNGRLADSQAEREIFACQIMDLVTPRPSEVMDRFGALYVEDPKAATDYFYQLSQQNDYIKTRAIRKNIVYRSETDYGALEITINLSKPEKDPKDIARMRTQKSSNYPLCPLCVENEGYRGRLDHAARTNHRIVRFPLLGEEWGLQFSPYAYYSEHCIFLAEEHRPMTIERSTFAKLFAIIEQFPHYFVGSNADLPIVGGSILAHDHYQGGAHSFAMAEAAARSHFTMEAFPDVHAQIVQWPMSVIRLSGTEKEALIEAATYILEKWRAYSDPEADILAHTTEPHNTVTPIARWRDEQFEIDLVLRNNRTSEAFPDGIFHPHPDVQHIKKENIGLIEVMGLAVLPGRLKAELEEVSKFLLGEAHQMAPMHVDWAEKIKAAHPRLTREQVKTVVQQEVGKIFLRVLEDAGVYKDTPFGRARFERFTETL